jgi:hypothetical protein
MKFATAVEDGFGIDRVTLHPKGYAMVSVGSSLDKEDRCALGKY